MNKLTIDDAEDLISLPKECLHQLSSLDIRDTKLVSTFRLEEVFDSLSSLRNLKFIYCHSLRSISKGLNNLIALESLILWDCLELDLLQNVQQPEDEEENEDGMPWKALNNLRSLLFLNVPKLLRLPSELQHLVNLRSLQISCNDEFLEVPEWISCFPSLESISLLECPKLTSLPEGFCKVTSLVQLEIMACPGLTERCRCPNGRDWPKIQHIPLVSVQESHRD